MSDYLLELRKITKRFPGTIALSEVDLQILPGEVHALVGENGAGKSTLMKIIVGIYKPDDGEIWFDGEKIHFMTPAEALNSGISMIPQELNPIMEMTIAENIFLHREPMKHGIFTDSNTQESMTRELLKKFNLSFSPKQKMKELTIAQMQMIEIAKAVSCSSKVVIMDEPTSSLDLGETKQLFETIRDLKSRGISIIYISHRLEEIHEICDRLTVFRDGHYIATRPVKNITRDEIIQMMVGRVVQYKGKIGRETFGTEVLSVKGLRRKGFFDDVSFRVREGEILGFSGLVGAGRSETMKSIFGLDPLDSGEVFWYGKKIKIANTSDAIKRGIAMVTEDRREYGLVLCRSILENTSLPSLRIKHSPYIDHRKEQKDVKEKTRQLSVKAPHVGVATKNLSGGNQQKVILAKWLMIAPKLIILDEPTRGIDVGAKDEIYKLISEFTHAGMAIILISSELSEVMWLSNRILVMHEGRITGEFKREDIVEGKVTQEDILDKSFGG
ncbi:sugar ABC transporter ATP-binding protein [Sediminispirochaeta smaragdinae]|uniref:ABC transporter related protein n=1 Tax=Sediminispirochaeta smaragdinae (strain DSM 11293 / JCM 15392 / SEBR 4228) TaxID=573413 RepID=E1RC77_SEDSS|nr:sugar ABC transporter ATP-binding protein [Sediminispirochaeta smaragdinae]ADK79957.1 ABC transporter related protein [Sediminispirochaeta smaragdinae DSM 11293]